MSAQMLSKNAQSSSGGNIDEMRLLEEEARKIAEESKKEQPKGMKTMSFVK